MGGELMLPEVIIKMCQTEALSQFLIDWGSHSYDEVIEILEHQGYLELNHDDIVSHDIYEYFSADVIRAEIVNHYIAFQRVAEETFARGANNG
jgi:hypothetical protein